MILVLALAGYPSATPPQRNAQYRENSRKPRACCMTSLSNVALLQGWNKTTLHTKWRVASSDVVHRTPKGLPIDLNKALLRKLRQLQRISDALLHIAGEGPSLCGNHLHLDDTM